MLKRNVFPLRIVKQYGILYEKTSFVIIADKKKKLIF